ncbi:MAG: hypothetical protein R2765_07955 [Ferruginibacter sp.]
MMFFVLLLSGLKLNLPLPKWSWSVPSLRRLRLMNEKLPDRPSRLPALAAVTLLVLLDAE